MNVSFRQSCDVEELKELLTRAPRWTVAAAESLTSGWVQSQLGSVSGSSLYFAGGITAYTIERKVRLLNVDRDEAQRVNAVSATVAEQMAVGVARLFQADWGLATTGYAEASAAENVAHPFAWWAISRRVGDRTQNVSGRFDCGEVPRIEAQQLVADELLRQFVVRLKEARTPDQ